MNYTKTVWKDLPDTSTPITADRLNNIEDGVEYLFENESKQGINEYSESTNDSYSCNYVNGVNTYSTDEIRVGTWMNKPLYRKVYSFSALSGNNSYTLNPAPSNVDKMWFDLSGTYLEESNGTIRQGIDSSAVDSAFDFSARVVSNTRAFVNILVGGSVYNGSTIYVTLLYTKTTD